MFSFCPEGESLFRPWIDTGLGRCFSSTLSTVPSFCLTPLILLHILFTFKHGHKLPSNLRNKSKLLHLQLSLCLLAPLFIIVHFLLLVSIVYGVPTFYGYLLNYPFQIFTWLLSCLAVYLDYTYLRPPHKNHHSYALLVFWASSFFFGLTPLLSLRSNHWWWSVECKTDIAEFTLWLGTIFCAFGALLLGFLAPGLPNSSVALYSFLQSSEDGTSARRNDNRWSRFYRRFKLLCPYIWPSRNRLVQFQVVMCVLFLVADRVVNLYVPIFYKRIVDSLTVPVNETTFGLGPYHNPPPRSFLHNVVHRLIGPNGLAYRWDYVLQFVAIRFLQGLGGLGGGLLGAIRSQLWIGVDQYSTRELSVLLFSHLHSLSLQWHLSRKTGEMLRIMDRGTASISNILSYMVFNIVPTIIDIFVGVGYFVVLYNAWYGTLVFATMAVYVGATVLVTEWRTKLRREMNKLDNQKSSKAVDALLNFETVKYFNAEQYEAKLFKEAFIDYQRAEWRTTASLNLLNTIQNAVIITGLLIGTLLCSRDVVLGRLTVGDFVLFYTYLLQLYAPLGFFGTYYRMLQTSMTDMENMFELMELKAQVTDLPNAQILQVHGGEVEFRNVCFCYSEDRPILKNISFRVPSGRTVALVGQSGAGKSTIVRLLFRFYDVTSGEILIDDQNIAEVTQSSLRSSIGVVPQDTVLFNDTIFYNIRYGRPSADEDEVRDAAASADIHDRIREFPQGYQTVVGERGLKLSGGEKQRVAIARNILKNPRIMILDEATSALDTTTERNIQASLYRISSNRTTLVVAHRLSTIVNADEILMMHQGEIVERGTHAHLLSIPDGRYAALWRAQVEAHST